MVLPIPILFANLQPSVCFQCQKKYVCVYCSPPARQGSLDFIRVTSLPPSLLPSFLLPPIADLSWQWRASTASSRSQWPCQRECQNKCHIECQKVCQNICQIECQKECQSICQKECRIECQNICIYIHTSNKYIYIYILPDGMMSK